MKRVLVTGGSGFIGSNFIKYLLTDQEISKEIQIVNVDKLTYAGQGKNLENMGISTNPRYRFVQADICNKEAIDKILSEFRPEIIFNFAAESHVDRSITDSDVFEQSNFIGPCNLFKLAIKHKVGKVVQISTDEVYGSIKNGSFSETAKLNPSSPYSATKAAADLVALSFFKTHGLPVVITRSANNFGPYQFPEKILPLFITNLIQRRKVPLMWTKENPGLNVRDWLYVIDNCGAIWYVAMHGIPGEIYNIPGENERTNGEITQMLLSYFGFGEEMIEKVAHRKAHDFRYSVDGTKLKKLGFKHSNEILKEKIIETIEWYKNNPAWWEPLKK